MQMRITVLFLIMIFIISSDCQAQISGAREKKERDKKIRILYDRAMESYYSGDLEKARLYWVKIKELDPSQRQLPALMRLVKGVETEKVEENLDRARAAYRKGEYTLAVSLYENILQSEEGLNNQTALKNKNKLSELASIIEGDAKEKDKKGRLIRITCTSYIEENGPLASETVTYLNQLYLEPCVEKLYDKVKETYSKDMEKLKILKNFPNLVSQHIGQGLDEFKKPGDSFISRKEHIRMAVSYYDRALYLDPEDVEAIVLKGLVEVEKRNFDKAINYWKKALGINRSKARNKIRDYVFDDDIVKHYFNLFSESEKDTKALKRLRKMTRKIL